MEKLIWVLSLLLITNLVSFSKGQTTTDTPAPGATTTTPAPGGPTTTTTPAPGGPTTTTTTPAPGGTPTTPAPGGTTTTPAPGGPTTTTTTPAPGATPSTPAPGETPTTPAPGGTTTTPAPGGPTTTPAPGATPSTAGPDTSATTTGPEVEGLYETTPFKMTLCQLEDVSEKKCGKSFDDQILAQFHTDLKLVITGSATCKTILPVGVTDNSGTTPPGYGTLQAGWIRRCAVSGTFTDPKSGSTKPFLFHFYNPDPKKPDVVVISYLGYRGPPNYSGQTTTPTTTPTTTTTTTTPAPTEPPTTHGPIVEGKYETTSIKMWVCKNDAASEANCNPDFKKKVKDTYKTNYNLVFTEDPKCLTILPDLPTTVAPQPGETPAPTTTTTTPAGPTTSSSPFLHRRCVLYGTFTDPNTQKPGPFRLHFYNHEHDNTVVVMSYFGYRPLPNYSTVAGSETGSTPSGGSTTPAGGSTPESTTPPGGSTPESTTPAGGGSTTPAGGPTPSSPETTTPAGG